MKYSILFIYQGSVVFGKQEHSIHIHFRWNWILCFLFIDERKTYLWLDITVIHQGCISKSPRINVFRKKQTNKHKQNQKQSKQKRKTQDNMHYFKDLTANIFRSDSCFSKIEIKKKNTMLSVMVVEDKSNALLSVTFNRVTLIMWGSRFNNEHYLLYNIRTTF